MKCEVCHTEIPLGSSKCPNCGMEIKEEIKDTKLHAKPISPVPSQKTLNVFSVLIPVFSIIIIALVIYGLVTGDMKHLHNNGTNKNEVTASTDFTGKTYDEILNIITIDLTGMGYTVDKNSGYELYDDQPDCEMTIYASKNNLEYEISYLFNASQPEMKTLDISGSYDGYESKSYEYLIEKDTNQLCQYIVIDTNYNVLKEYHNKLEIDEENSGVRFYIGNSDDTEICISEKSGEDYNKTLFSYLITQY